MADDLDDFLKQAALRRQQRQQQKRTQLPPVAQPTPEQSRPRPEPPRLQPQVPTAEVIEYATPYKPSLGNLSPTLPSGNLGRGVERAEERIESHLKHAFPPELGKIRSTNPTPPKKKDQPTSLLETPATAAEPQPTAKVSAVTMIKQLRDPQTLRMAIIAHEIMKRPW